MSGLEQKNEEYKEYVDNHIKAVHESFNKFGKELCDRLNIDYRRLEDQINDHDESKYSKEEFEGYRCYFYPTSEEEQDNENIGYRKKKFDAAWLHHLRNNAHHPEFWIYMDKDGNPKCKPMDPLHIAEMLLDWQAMGVKFKDNAYKYWSNNAYFKPLHKDSVALINSCINIFKDT